MLKTLKSFRFGLKGSYAGVFAVLLALCLTPSSEAQIVHAQSSYSHSSHSHKKHHSSPPPEIEPTSEPDTLPADPSPAAQPDSWLVTLSYFAERLGIITFFGKLGLSANLVLLLLLLVPLIFGLFIVMFILKRLVQHRVQPRRRAALTTYREDEYAPATSSRQINIPQRPATLGQSQYRGPVRSDAPIAYTDTKGQSAIEPQTKGRSPVKGLRMAPHDANYLAQLQPQVSTSAAANWTAQPVEPASAASIPSPVPEESAIPKSIAQTQPVEQQTPISETTPPEATAHIEIPLQPNLATAPPSNTSTSTANSAVQAQPRQDLPAESKVESSDVVRTLPISSVRPQSLSAHQVNSGDAWWADAQDDSPQEKAAPISPAHTVEASQPDAVVVTPAVETEAADISIAPSIPKPSLSNTDTEVQPLAAVDSEQVTQSELSIETHAATLQTQPISEAIPVPSEDTDMESESAGMQCKAQTTAIPSGIARICNAAVRQADQSSVGIFRWNGYKPELPSAPAPNLAAPEIQPPAIPEAAQTTPLKAPTAEVMAQAEPAIQPSLAPEPTPAPTLSPRPTASEQWGLDDDSGSHQEKITPTPSLPPAIDSLEPTLTALTSKVERPSIEPTSGTATLSAIYRPPRPNRPAAQPIAPNTTDTLTAATSAAATIDAAADTQKAQLELDLLNKLPQISAADALNESYFKLICKRAFLEIQEACQEKNLEVLRYYATPTFFSSLEPAIEEDNTSGHTARCMWVETQVITAPALDNSTAEIEFIGMVEDPQTGSERFHEIWTFEAAPNSLEQPHSPWLVAKVESIEERT